MRKGFTLIELIIATAILSIVAFSFIEAVIPQIEHNKKEKTLETMRKLSQALDFHYETVVAYRKNNPDWITKADCSVERSWLAPPGCWNYSSRLILWKDDATPSSSEILKTFESLGCKLKTNGTGYEVECYDAWGTPFRYSYDNGDKTHSVPYDPDAGRPVRITITSAGRDRTFGTSDDLTYTWSSASLDEKYRKLTYDELKTIADALDSYFRQRLSVEVTERIYPNGLSEEDDLKVDWYVQLCSSKPYDYCQDSTCSNLRSVWPAVTCDGSLTRSTCDIDTILTHLNLDSSYRTDAFGNPVYVNLCFDPDGDGYPNGSPPNTPAGDRGAFSASVSDGSITVMSTGE